MEIYTKLPRNFTVSIILIYKMKIVQKNFVNKRGYSLAELLAALIISSMIIIAVFSIYGRLNKVSASVTGRLEKNQNFFRRRRYFGAYLCSSRASSGQNVRTTRWRAFGVPSDNRRG